jgi:hypothetical protein
MEQKMEVLEISEDALPNRNASSSYYGASFFNFLFKTECLVLEVFIRKGIIYSSSFYIKERIQIIKGQE